jgi:hypothetical protein
VPAHSARTSADLQVLVNLMAAYVMTPALKVEADLIVSNFPAVRLSS